MINCGKLGHLDPQAEGSQLPADIDPTEFYPSRRRLHRWPAPAPAPALDHAAIKRELETKGYTVIPGILSQAEIADNLALFRSWQASVPDHDYLYETSCPHGIYKHHQVGHQEHAWSIRTNPRVQSVFAALWHTHDLNVSFDGCCYIPASCTKQDTIWTHSDQPPTQHGAACYQGFVSLTHNKERTLVVYDGTHKIHKEYFEAKGRGDDPKPWQRIDTEDVEAMADRKRVLEVPAGALVLWDSRTFHQNQYGAPGSEERIVQYVCYLPKSHPKNTKAMQRKRRAYYAELRTTSHWPSPIRVNPQQPQAYGDERRRIDYRALPAPNLDRFDEEIRKLL